MSNAGITIGYSPVSIGVRVRDAAVQQHSTTPSLRSQGFEDEDDDEDENESLTKKAQL